VTIKNSYIEAIIRDIELNHPEFLRANDLIATGLYKTRSDISWAMKRGQTPPSIKLSSHKIIFPRASLCEWLKEKATTCIIGGAQDDAKLKI
jgi:predicted DNA-binding transcriptional regulator AlpA